VLPVERERGLHRLARAPSRNHAPIAQTNDADDVTHRSGRQFTVVRAKQLGLVGEIRVTVRLHPLGDDDAVVAGQRHIDPVLAPLDLTLSTPQHPSTEEHDTRRAASPVSASMQVFVA
jgi:hypothetical protein